MQQTRRHNDPGSETPTTIVLAETLHAANTEQITAVATVVVTRWAPMPRAPLMTPIMQTLDDLNGDGDHVASHAFGVVPMLARLRESPGANDAFARFTIASGNLDARDQARLDDAIEVLRSLHLKRPRSSKDRVPERRPQSTASSISP